MDAFIDEVLELEEVEIVNEINPDRRPYIIGERVDHFELLEFVIKIYLSLATTCILALSWLHQPFFKYLTTTAGER